MSKGSNRRPEAVKGAYERGYERTFGKSKKFDMRSPPKEIEARTCACDQPECRTCAMQKHIR